MRAIATALPAAGGTEPLAGPTRGLVAAYPLAGTAVDAVTG